MLLFNTISSIIAIVSFIDAHLYLYHTQDGPALEFYDCFIAYSLYFCRRPTSPIHLTRDQHHNESCQLNGGYLHTFSQLKSKNISPSIILHEWRSSIERVEHYSRYLNNPIDANDGYICQCIDLTAFGKNCEYRLPFGLFWGNTIVWRQAIRNYFALQLQMHDDIVCYTTVNCSTSHPCLDWREICDGIQQCESAIDEENCDLLEMNVCDDDEYRCMNGMCIPDEYFLDGDFDCLDWSDEIQYKKSDECTREIVNTICDDHICPPNEWSCGDGQCIRDRLAFTRNNEYMTCQNRRDQYSVCEMNAIKPSWTMSNGRCHIGTVYDASLSPNRTRRELCEYIIRCIVSDRGEKHCSCPYGPSCANEVDRYCLGLLLVYPRTPWITSYSYRFYDFVSNSLIVPQFLFSGRVKCRQSFISITGSPAVRLPLMSGRLLQSIACGKEYSFIYTEHMYDAQDCHHQNESTNICDEWNPCMSITRLRDGFTNCLNEKDESIHTNMDIHQTCFRVRRHRFHCSTKEPTCLSVMALGNNKLDCQNSFDEVLYGTGGSLSLLYCNDQRKDHCSLIRRYIEQSWMTSDHGQLSSIDRRIPFRSYCDTFWDLDPPEDENQSECRKWWRCAQDQPPCLTNQCINQMWLFDDEWDCPLAEDEKYLLGVRALDVHRNILSVNASDSQSRLILDTCGTQNDFLCLLPETSHPQFYCINQTRIGDGHIDCAGAIDEQNTFTHCQQSSMLGQRFLCVSTNTCIPYFYHCQPGYRCPNTMDDEAWCSHIDRSRKCSNADSFMCLNEVCKIRARCNPNAECPYREDEYMCDYRSTAKRILLQYRSEKRLQMKSQKNIFELPFYPNSTQTYVTLKNNTSSEFDTFNISSFNSSSIPSHLSVYRCNRGVGMLATDNTTICFCPPQYYGERCQYHNDRLSVLIHLNLSQSNYSSRTDPNMVLKLLLVFLHYNQTLMIHEFHIRPGIVGDVYDKKMAHFVYSHGKVDRKERQNRYFNRSDLLLNHPYSIQIDLYQLHGHEEPALIGVWKYPIFFDYLPVYRFSKVLHLRQVNESLDGCRNHSCPATANCHALMNNPSKYICVCKTNRSGDDCSVLDEECLNGYCGRRSLCKGNYRFKYGGNRHPYCICSSGRFGDRCDVEVDLCQPNPCQNGGTCVSATIPDHLLCLCTDEYYGNRCQHAKRYIHLSVTTSLQYTGSVIQYFNIDSTSMDLYLVHQQAYKFVPERIKYYFTEAYVPNVVLTKLYSSDRSIEPQIHLLSLSERTPYLEVATNIFDFNRCWHVRELSSDFSPIRYHSLCQNDINLVCFRDDQYLCLCVDNHTRTECFNYDYQLDRCSRCLHDGRCLQGHPRRSNDFVCLCPRCHSGGQCQFSSKSFTVTLDQLFYTDLTVSQRSQTTLTVLTFFSCLVFLFGIPNNVLSFVTFRRKPCLRNGIGNYLLTLSVMNQINLALLAARLIHLSVNMISQISSSTIDTIFCKSFNYFLVSSTRMVYWLSSLIAIERVYITVTLNGQWLKQPRVARRLIVLIAIIIFLTTSYELLFYKSLSIFDTKARSMCVFEIPITYRSQLVMMHLFVSTFHSIVPFVINLCSTMTISIIVVKNKINTQRTKKSQAMNFLAYISFVIGVLNENRELVLGSGLTLIPQLFSLPLFIASLTLDCQNIENSWIRYLLISSYWISFTPQMISFLLYISPSSLYSDEWRKTMIGKRVNAALGWSH